MFRMFYRGNPFQQATAGMARGTLVIGLLLIGFGMLVFILRDLFAFLAAALFFMAGFSAIGYAIKLFLIQHKMKKSDNVYREGVEIHFNEDDRF